LVNLFIIEHVLENTNANQDNPIKIKMKYQGVLEANDFSILKKRRWFHADKITCWELVAKAQMIMEVEAVCDTKVTIDDDIVGEGGE
jgi:hypothetical protein